MDSLKSILSDQNDIDIDQKELIKQEIELVKKALNAPNTPLETNYS